MQGSRQTEVGFVFYLPFNKEPENGSGCKGSEKITELQPPAMGCVPPTRSCCTEPHSSQTWAPPAVGSWTCSGNRNGNSSVQTPCAVPPASPTVKFHSSKKNENNLRRNLSVFLALIHSLQRELLRRASGFQMCYLSAP